MNIFNTKVQNIAPSLNSKTLSSNNGWRPHDAML